FPLTKLKTNHIMKAVSVAQLINVCSNVQRWRWNLNWEEERLLYKIAKLYYEDNRTQGDIAKQVGIYRTTIGRMLKKARREGIVRIEIVSSLNEQFQLEDKI